MSTNDNIDVIDDVVEDIEIVEVEKKKLTHI